MPKFKNTPRTLTAKLHFKQLANVKKYLPYFLNKAKKQHKSQLPDSVTLAKEYIEYLSAKDKSFCGVDLEAVTTRDEGFKQLYDHLRKKIGRYDEEKSATAAPLPATSKGSPQKSSTPGKGKAAKAEPPAQVQDQGQYQGHHEEKEVQRRLHIDSAHEESEHEMGDHGEPSESSMHSPSSTSRASQSLLGKRRWRETKKRFIRLIDTYNEAELGTFTFVVEFGKDGVNVTHEDRSTYVAH